MTVIALRVVLTRAITPTLKTARLSPCLVNSMAAKNLLNALIVSESFWRVRCSLHFRAPCRETFNTRVLRLRHDEEVQRRGLYVWVDHQMSRFRQEVRNNRSRHSTQTRVFSDARRPLFRLPCTPCLVMRCLSAQHNNQQHTSPLFLLSWRWVAWCSP